MLHLTPDDLRRVIDGLRRRAPGADANEVLRNFKLRQRFEAELEHSNLRLGDGTDGSPDGGYR